jgi:hypothetical protein
MDYSRYPDDWAIISAYIRFVRANNHCEFCGAENYKPHPVTGSIVILTTAHLDHDPENTPSIEEIKAGDPRGERLKALCQRCHLNYDRPRHLEKARITREKKKGQLQLFSGGA